MNTARELEPNRHFQKMKNSEQKIWLVFILWHLIRIWIELATPNWNDRRRNSSQVMHQAIKLYNVSPPPPHTKKTFKQSFLKIQLLSWNLVFCLLFYFKIVVHSTYYFEFQLIYILLYNINNQISILCSVFYLNALYLNCIVNGANIQIYRTNKTQNYKVDSVGRSTGVCTNPISIVTETFLIRWSLFRRMCRCSISLGIWQ